MALQIKKAIKQKLHLRMAINGPTGSGKTYTALVLATALGTKIGFIDTERGSASLYADEFDFDVIELDNFAPKNYIEAIRLFRRNGYDVLVIDSLTHAWNAEGGVLDIANGRFGGWKEATPAHNSLIQEITGQRDNMHIIVTMRTKMDYLVTEVEEKGQRKQKVEKLGLAPIQRDELPYELDVVADMDVNHTMTISKTRCKMLDGRVFRNPDGEVANILKEWLGGGEDVPNRDDLITNLSNYRAALRNIGIEPEPIGREQIKTMSTTQLASLVEATKTQLEAQPEKQVPA